MSKFEPAYQRTIGHEGGYVNNPTDRGRETYKGISRRYHPDWMGWPLIDSTRTNPNFPENLRGMMALEVLVERFYHREFWVALNIASIHNQSIASEVFDTAVNCGAKRAIRFLQEALNLCNQNNRLYLDLTMDGQIGPHTSTAANGFPDSRTDILLKVLNLLQGEYYLKICRKDPTQEAFLHGWVRKRITLGPTPDQSIH